MALEDMQSNYGPVNKRNQKGTGKQAEDLLGFADCNSCDPPEGCTDEEACNYDYLAVISIDACFYVYDYCSDLDYPEYYDCDCKYYDCPAPISHDFINEA